ncbi:MAG: response regulator, partial [Polyangiaceae bacterium]|nr:response regulator [Polyangiaceae bacterium]
ASVPEAPRGKTPLESSSRGTILVIDDEPVVADTTRRLLEASGYTVLIARDGQEGVATFEATLDIQLVLLDLSLPKMSGAEVFRALRASRPEVPVVLCSGYDRDDAASRVGEGLAGVLQKPWRLEQLLTTIEGALGHAHTT